jgi:hypothetical protein
MARYLVVMVGLALGAAGCSDDETARPMDMAVADLAAALDLQPGPSIGADCRTNTDCRDGNTPTCFKASGSVTGFCSAKCTKNTDCGNAATCVQFSDGNFCMKNCSTGTDCPMSQSCFISLSNNPVCFPSCNSNTFCLDCDPTVAACKTKVGSLDGGCIRRAAGMGKTGMCKASCVAGSGTCPLNGTTVQQCLVFDQTTDSSGMATGDALKGPICTSALASTDQKNDGEECLYSDGNHYIDVCHDGSECDLFMGATNMPDQKCHPLCYKSGFMPMGSVPDGGVPAMTCADCKDAFGLFSTPTPIGLCK